MQLIINDILKHNGDFFGHIRFPALVYNLKARILNKT
jgi:hypothetical protein